MEDPSHKTPSENEVLSTVEIISVKTTISKHCGIILSGARALTFCLTFNVIVS